MSKSRPTQAHQALIRAIVDLCSDWDTEPEHRAQLYEFLKHNVPVDYFNTMTRAAFGRWYSRPSVWVFSPSLLEQEIWILRNILKEETDALPYLFRSGNTGVQLVFRQLETFDRSLPGQSEKHAAFKKALATTSNLFKLQSNLRGKI